MDKYYLEELFETRRIKIHCEDIIISQIEFLKGKKLDDSLLIVF